MSLFSRGTKETQEPRIGADFSVGHFAAVATQAFGNLYLCILGPVASREDGRRPQHLEEKQ